MKRVLGADGTALRRPLGFVDQEHVEERNEPSGTQVRGDTSWRWSGGGQQWHQPPKAE